MTSQRYILLVEDNPDDEALTVRTLKRSNVINRVEVKHNGEEALNHLFQPNQDGELNMLPMVVLLDLKLPKVDGLEVLSRIRSEERTRRLPVVVLTSSSEEQDILKSYDLGANSYVRKPVDFNEFSEAVGKLGLYWALLNEPLL